MSTSKDTTDTFQTTNPMVQCTHCRKHISLIEARLVDKDVFLCGKCWDTSGLCIKAPKEPEHAAHFDSGKPRLELLPYESLAEIAKVFDYGFSKYGVGNWSKGMLWTKMAASILRHTYKWLAGIDKDEESGLSHMAHAGACVVMILYYEQYKKEMDNRLTVR